MGERYRDEALVSLASLRNHVPGSHVTVVCDIKAEWQAVYDQVIISEIHTEKPYLYKVNAIALSPYQETFYIDTDTYFCDGCEELFDMLEYFDLLISHCSNDYFAVYNEAGHEIRGYYSYNTGVIVFKNSHNVKDLLSKWREAYIDHFDKYIHDQPPFMEALLCANVKHYVLQNIYNARTPYPFGLIARPVKIIHGRHKDMAKIDKKLNKAGDSPRVWFPRFQLVLSYRRTYLFKWYMGLDTTYKSKVKRLIKPIIMKLGMRDYI